MGEPAEVEPSRHRIAIDHHEPVTVTVVHTIKGFDLVLTVILAKMAWTIGDMVVASLLAGR